MMKRTMVGSVIAASVIVGGAGLALQAQGGGQTQQGVTYRSPGGTTLRLMLDENNLGTEVSLGEMVFPANTDSGEHAHDAIEIFYVILR
ncbi:MAG: hypothetical protein QM736_25950 [Vicinamibacterales bacterium]